MSSFPPNTQPADWPPVPSAPPEPPPIVAVTQHHGALNQEALAKAIPNRTIGIQGDPTGTMQTLVVENFDQSQLDLIVRGLTPPPPDPFIAIRAKAAAVLAGTAQFTPAEVQLILAQFVETNFA